MCWDFPSGSVVKNPPAMHETQELRVPFLGWEDARGGGNGSPLQYSCLENTINRGAWQATVRRIAKSQMRLSTHAMHNGCIKYQSENNENLCLPMPDFISEKH